MKNFLQKLAIIIFLIALSIPSLDAQAAVTANSIITPQTPNRGILQFLPASTPGVYVTAYTAGANGSKVVGISMNNSDSATHVVTCQLVNATLQYGGVTLLSTATAGFASGTNGQAMLSSTLWPGGFTDANGNYGIILSSGDTIQCTYATAVTAAKALNILVTAMDY